jgi:hypothetical protein
MTEGVGAMAENYKRLYEQTKKMLTMYQDEIVPGLRKVIEEQERKWIPVSDRLPKEFISVLVHIPEMNPCPPVMEAYRIGDGWVTKMAAFDINCATHWMPLPEPPAEDE